MIDATGKPGERAMDIPSLVEAAMDSHQRGDLDTAESMYGRILANAPGHFTVTYLLGVLHNQRGNFLTAAQFLERALQINPRSALSHLNLGQSLWNLDRPEEALFHYRRSLALNPEHPEALMNCALASQSLQQPAEALACWDCFLTLHPDTPVAILNRGMALQDLQRPAEAMTCFQQALALEVGLTDMLLSRARDLRHTLRPAEALTILDLLLERRPDWLQALLVCGILLVDLQRNEQALGLYDRALIHHPDSVDLWLDRGNALMGLQRYGEALTSYERILALVPDHADGLMNRGNALLALHRPLEALAGFDRALALRPDHADIHLNRGNAQLQLGRPLESLASFDRALALKPHNPEALLNRANALLALNRPAEALASCDLSLILRPDGVEAFVNRGTALLELKRPEEALVSFERALALRPDYPDLLMNHGTALHLLGRHREAIASYDKALALDPEHARAHSNKIYLLDFLPEVDFREHQLARANYFQAHANRFVADETFASKDRSPSRRLVLGYVSADFKHHSAASCFLPILQRHAKAAFQLNCYSGVQVEDDWTRRFRACADVWCPTTGLSDEELAVQVRNDGVDILIDLSGHSKGNRLLVFARKPAPIQVTAWGHGGGTGLPMIDYQFTDPIIIPTWARPWFAEASYDLPCCITFEAPPSAPPVQPLPARSKGFVTFGSLNRFTKVTPAVKHLWAQILHAVPDSQLLLKDGLFDEPKGRAAVLASFAKLGIGQERIVLKGFTSRRDHLATCGEVDIMLDTFPQNGGITTWEALWMGTPVLAMLGNKLASRISGAILHALKLDGWVVEDEEQYLALAIHQAADLDALERFRQDIRTRILASPAGDPVRYTRAVEEAYRAMWNSWLDRQTRVSAAR